MKTILFTLTILLSMAANAKTVAELDKMFKKGRQVSRMDKVMAEIVHTYGRAYAEDMDHFVNDKNGDPKYLEGDVYACELRRGYYRGIMTIYGIKFCMKMD